MLSNNDNILFQTKAVHIGYEEYWHITRKTHTQNLK